MHRQLANYAFQTPDVVIPTLQEQVGEPDVLSVDAPPERTAVGTPGYVPSESMT